MSGPKQRAGKFIDAVAEHGHARCHFFAGRTVARRRQQNPVAVGDHHGRNVAIGAAGRKLKFERL